MHLKVGKRYITKGSEEVTIICEHGCGDFLGMLRPNRGGMELAIWSSDGVYRQSIVGDWVEQQMKRYGEHHRMYFDIWGPDMTKNKVLHFLARMRGYLCT